MTIVVLVAHTPLVAIHAFRLWQLPHYRYVPLVFAAAAWLAWKRCQIPVASGRPAPRLALLLLFCSAVLLSGAVFLHSPWLAAVSLNVALGGLAFAWRGGAAWRQLGPPWLLLWLTIPLPMRWDLQLISQLQTITSRLSSNILDMLSIPHLMAGNVLEFPEKRFLVEEACSGVHSLFALVTATAVYLIWQRRPWTVAVMMLPASVVAAVVMNMGRVTTIANVYHATGRDLSTGWPHEALGFGTFVLALLLLAAVEQIALFLFRPIPEQWHIQSHWDTGVAWRICQWWNGVFAGVIAAPVVDENRDAQLRQGEPSVFVCPRSPRPQSIGIVVILLAFGGLAVAPWVMFAVGRESVIPVMESAEKLDLTSLPDRLGMWQRMGFERVERDTSSYQGQHTAAWDYRGREYNIRFACDYPFVGWHELPDCYLATGWTVVSRDVVNPTSGGEQAPYVCVRLHKPSGESGLLCFSLIDSRAQPGPILPTKHAWLLDLKYRLSKGMARYGWDMSTYQIQAFAWAPGNLPSGAELEMEPAYLMQRDQLVKHLSGK